MMSTSQEGEVVRAKKNTTASEVDDVARKGGVVRAKKASKVVDVARAGGFVRVKKASEVLFEGAVVRVKKDSTKKVVEYREKVAASLALEKEERLARAKSRSKSTVVEYRHVKKEPGENLAIRLARALTRQKVERRLAAQELRRNRIVRLAAKEQRKAEWIDIETNYTLRQEQRRLRYEQRMLADAFVPWNNVLPTSSAP